MTNLKNWRMDLKFIAPALLALAATIEIAVTRGSLDAAALQAGIFGVIAATVTLIITNGTGGVKKYARALGPAVLTVIAVGLHYLIQGDFNAVDARAAAAGLLAAIVAFVIPASPPAAS